MLVLFLFFLLVLLVGGAAPAPAPAARSIPRVTVLAQNMSWLENLMLDPDSQSLFFSELKYGRIWKVSDTNYTREIWVSNLSNVLGLARNPLKPGYFYGVGKQTNGTNILFQASTVTKETMKIIARLPDSTMGNGLGCHHATGKLYTTSEANFRPGTGRVYEIDPDTGSVTTITGGATWGADGLWIDQRRHLLYVGQVSNSKMFVWNITGVGAVPLGSLPKGDGVGVLGFMDDFTLDASNMMVVAASWRKNAIVTFPAYGSNQTNRSTVLVDNSLIKHPTSARYGEASDPLDPFPDTSLFITEGCALDYLKPKDFHSSRLLRVDF